MDEDYKIVVVHDRVYGKNQDVMNWYPYLSLMARRPNALKYTGFYKKLPEPWQEYLNECNYQQKKKALSLLSKMINKNSMDAAAEALVKTIEKGVKDTDSIFATWYRITNNIPEPPEIQISGDILELVAFKPNLKEYDSLFRAGEAK